MNHLDAEENGVGHVQTHQSNVVVLSSGTSNNTSAGNSEASPRLRPPHDKEYDTPPDNIIEATSPTSSRKRGLLRAASLGIGSHATRAFRQASSSPRSPGSRRVPRPIFTGALVSRFNSNQRLEMASADEEMRASNGVAHGAQQVGGNSLPPMRLAQRFQGPEAELEQTDLHSRGCESYSLAEVEGLQTSSADPVDANPYAHRADEIGPTHRIPGIGHLGNLLVPPGWKEGDAPVAPHEARDLYKEARKQAQNVLDKTNEDIESISTDEQDTRNQERDHEWSKQFKLDDLVLKERIKIYEEYHERKKLRVRRNLTLPAPLPSPGQLPLHTMQPQTSTSIPQYTEPLAFNTFARRSTSSLGFRLREQVGSEQALAASTSYADPRSLDPSLLNQSVPAVYNRFQSSQYEIMRKKAETEQQFGSFLAQYSGIPNGAISPNPRSPLTGAQAGPFASVHTGYNPQPSAVQSGYLPRPLPFVSPTQARFDPWRHNLPRISPLDHPMNAGVANSFPVGPEVSRYSVGSAFHDHGGYGMRNLQIDPANVTDMLPSQTRSDPENITLDTDGIRAQVIRPRKKRASRAKPTEVKEKAWYYEDVKKANLPTSFISEEAEQAGEEFEGRQSKGIRTKKTVTPSEQAPAKPQRSRRTRKPAIDPSKGFPISARAADQLVKGGFLKRPDMASLSTSQLRSGTASKPGSGLNEAPQPHYPTPGPKSNFVYSQKPAAVNTSAGSDAVAPVTRSVADPTVVDVDDSELSSGSERSDDPKDGTFNAPPRRKTVNTKQTATRGRKRKLADNTPKGKRSRVSTDGVQDDEEEEYPMLCAHTSSQHPQDRQVHRFMSTKMPTSASGSSIRDSYGV